MKLSIVIPAYNERRTIAQAIRAVEEVHLPGITKELIVVDDGSTDGTREVLRGFGHHRVIFKEKNEGKGAAVTQGLLAATGDFAIIQDADLEYDAGDYPDLLGPLIGGKADVVLGSRFISHKPHRVLYFWHFLGNRCLTLFSNVLTGLNLTDMETCYKAFNRRALGLIAPKLTSRRFGIEPEIVALAARQDLRIYEVGVTYFGRTYAEGKKIGWKDGFAALWHITKHNLFR